LDGVMLTNGPGDPGDVQVATGTVRELLGVKPIFGICMGHQVLGLALGAKTYKLNFGHRGSNHPIKDQLLEKVYMTSQNHGYAVEASTLPKHAKITHTNLNDNTVAGFFSEEKNCLGIQYHPESRPGPHEAQALFDFFVDRMIGKK
jgi:carbamoyl-phosphate synthase small subunit